MPTTLIDLTGVAAPSGAMLRARLYQPATNSAIPGGDLALSESPAGSGQFAAADTRDLPDAADRPYQIEVRRVTEQSDAAFDASTAVYLFRGDFGCLKNGVWLLHPYLDARVSQIGGGGTSGGGATELPVDHDTGGTDNLRVEALGVGVAGAKVRAYLASDWAASRATAPLLGSTATGPDGRWLQPIYLVPGHTYTLVADKPGVMEVVTKDIAI